MPNMTPFEDSRSIFEAFVSINTISDGLLAELGLVTLWIVLLMVLLGKGNTPAESFMGATGSLSIITLMFMSIGLIGMIWFVGFTVLFALTAIGVYLRNKVG